MLNNLLAIVGGLFLFATKYAGANSGSVALLIIGRIWLGVNAGKLCKEFSRYFTSNIKQVLVNLWTSIPTEIFRKPWDDGDDGSVIISGKIDSYLRYPLITIVPHHIPVNWFALVVNELN